MSKEPLPDKLRAILQDELPRRLTRARLQYERTLNPIHFWRAYAELRELGITELPDWMVHYLDEAARNILEISDRYLEGEKFDPAGAVAEAMLFKKPGKSAENMLSRTPMISGGCCMGLRLTLGCVKAGNHILPSKMWRK